MHLNPILALQNPCEEEFVGSFTPFPDDTEAQLGKAICSMPYVKAMNRKMWEGARRDSVGSQGCPAPTRGYEAAVAAVVMDPVEAGGWTK